MKIAILRNLKKPETADFMNRLISENKSRSQEFIDISGLEDINAQMKIAKSADLIVVLGGDGTTLKAVSILSGLILGGEAIPVLLSVDFGRRGVLSGCSPENAAFLLNKYRENKGVLNRQRLGEVIDNESGKSFLFLNEAAILRYPESPSLTVCLKTEVSEHITRSDGLVLATNTGASAYARSAGGPEIVGLNDVIVAVFLSSEDRVEPIVYGKKALPALISTKRGRASLSIDGKVVKDSEVLDLVVNVTIHEIAFLVDELHMIGKRVRGGSAV